MHRALVAIVLTISGCNSGAAAPPGAATPPGAAAPPAMPQPPLRDAPANADLRRLAGKPLYLQLCAPCHGADGKGYAADHAPSLVNPTFLESASDEFLRRSTAAGRPGTSMAAYGTASGGPLDDAGVERLVAYLRAQGPAAKQLPETRGGDVRTGAAVYAKRCVTCHGDATMRGEAVWLANPQFQATATDPFVRYAIANGRPGTKMEAFAGTLTGAEIDGVVRYVRTLGSALGTAPGTAPGTAGAPAAELLPEPTGKEPLVLNPSGRHPSFTLRADPCPTQPATQPPGTQSPATQPGTQPPAAACKPDPRFVSVDQVAKALAGKQRLIVIDARPPSEWRRVHIQGAVSIPYHDMKRLDEVPKDGTWIVAYCGCPHHLSGIVVDELRRRGYAHAAVLDEGINEWHRRDLPVVAAEGVTKPVPEAALPAGTIR